MSLLTLAVGQLYVSDGYSMLRGFTHVAIHIHLLAFCVEDPVFAILLGNTLRTLLESLHSRVRPPISQSTVFVILAAGIVKGVCELMGSNSAESAVFQVGRPVVRVERRLKDASREDDLSVRRG